MLTVLDSSYFLPDDAGLQAAKAGGIDGWFLYIGQTGDGLAKHSDKSVFDRIKAAGMMTAAFTSGWDDPAWVRDTLAAYGIRGILDCESGIRGDGSWVDPWNAISGCALYGGSAVHSHPSVGHVLADYPGGDPKATWPSWLAAPSGMLAWQCIGTHDEFGGPVDRSYFDDSWASWLKGDEVSEQDVLNALNTGTAPGQPDWASTNKAILATIQDLENKIVALGTKIDGMKAGAVPPGTTFTATTK